LVTLGRAEPKGATFLIGGHTGAAGGDNYNQSLSERRAEAVKIFLAQQFKLPPDQLLASASAGARSRTPPIRWPLKTGAFRS
jgi:outer membrane protein OmpA-like peptidoglycan-associated protein